MTGDTHDSRGTARPARTSPAHALLAALLAPIGAAWALRRAAAYRKSARPLAPAERAALAPCFPASLLDSARVAEVRRINDPAGLALLRRVAGPGVLDLSLVAGLALPGVVVIATDHAPEWSPDAPTPSPSHLALLFHECVHLAQWRALGAVGFARAYVRGFLAAGRSYRDNPLEAQAFDLTARFTRGERPDVWTHIAAYRSVRTRRPCA